MRFDSIKKQVYWLMNLGINHTLSNYDKIRIRILNSLILLILCFQLSVWIQEFIQMDFQGIKILFFHLVFSVTLLYLNTKQYFRTSSFLINFVYPTAFLGLVFIYLPPNNLQYIFVLFIFTSIVISEKIWEKMFLVCVNFGYYIISQSELEIVGSMGKEMDTINNFLIFVMSIGIFIIILQILLFELRNYENNNKNLILRLEKQNQELLSANKELERFTYVVSHDMKTPLRAINSFLSIIEKKLSKEDVEIKRYFIYVKEGTKQLHHLIIDSLEYARLGKDAIDFSRVSTNELLFDLIRQFVDKNIEIYTEDFPDLYTNQTLVRKLFQNLIENGIKYNNSEVKVINISVKRTKEDAIFSFKDNGIGIKKEYHEQIFGMYKRLNTKAEFSGTGLGLAICQKIALQLNGEIWVNSEVGKGSTFFIRLPKAK